MHTSELSVVMKVAVVERLNFSLFIVVDKVVSLLNAIFDDTKFHFCLFFFKSSEILSSFTKSVHQIALITSITLNIKGRLRMGCVKNKIIFSSRLIFYFFIWIFFLLLSLLWRLTEALMEVICCVKRALRSNLGHVTAYVFSFP